MRRFLLSGLLLAVCTLSPAGAQAGTVNLHGVATPDTGYFEYDSDAFFRMDLYDPPPRETQQRFHAISAPSVTFGSTAFDGFPNDDDFRLGYVEYDESGLGGGDGQAPITNLVLSVSTDPNNSSHINYGRWTDVNTVITTSPSALGTVTLTGGQVSSIDLDSVGYLEIVSAGNLQLPGTFTVDGNFFEGYFLGQSGSGGDVIYTFSGTLNTVVPEPSTWVLASLGALGLIVVGRRSRQVACSKATN